MAAIVRCASAALAPSLQRNISCRKSFAPAPIAPLKSAIARNAAVRARHVVVAASSMSNTVKIIVQGRNLQVTPAIKEYAETKVNKVRSGWLKVLGFCDYFVLGPACVILFS